MINKKKEKINLGFSSDNVRDTRYANAFFISLPATVTVPYKS
jgi:hypothetical protein